MFFLSGKAWNVKGIVVVQLHTCLGNSRLEWQCKSLDDMISWFWIYNILFRTISERMAVGKIEDYKLSAWVVWWISIFSTVMSGFIAVASWMACAKASSWSIGSPSDWMVTFCSTRVSVSPLFSQEYVVVSTVLDLKIKRNL